MSPVQPKDNLLLAFLTIMIIAIIFSAYEGEVSVWLLSLYTVGVAIEVIKYFHRQMLKEE